MATSPGRHDSTSSPTQRARSTQRRNGHSQPGRRRLARSQECAARLQVPPHARRLGTDLFNQQMWCWGYDVRCPTGNLLIAYGFERHSPPPDTRYTSAYHLRLGPQQSCTLWGFGMHYLDETAGALFLKRFGFAPDLLADTVAPEGVFEPAQLSPPKTVASHADLACTRDLLVAALRWIAAYEEWVLTTVGVEHRHQALEAWRLMRKRVVTGPDTIGDAWIHLADECSRVETAR